MGLVRIGTVGEAGEAGIRSTPALVPVVKGPLGSQGATGEVLQEGGSACTTRRWPDMLPGAKRGTR